MEVGAPIVRMGWHPNGLSVLLPLLSFPAVNLSASEVSGASEVTTL